MVKRKKQHIKLTEEQIKTLKENGIKRQTADSRIKVLNWSIEDAINKPVATPKVKCYAFRVDEETNRAMVDFMEREGLTITDFITKSIVFYLLAMPEANTFFELDENELSFWDWLSLKAKDLNVEIQEIKKEVTDIGDKRDRDGNPDTNYLAFKVQEPSIFFEHDLDTVLYFRFRNICFCLEILKHKPNDYIGWLKMCQQLKRLGERIDNSKVKKEFYEKALLAFEKIVKINPSFEFSKFSCIREFLVDELSKL